MEFEKNTERAWLAWACVTLVVGCCGVLAVLQYRWIGEVAGAERARLKADLQSRLNLLRRNFDDQISAACLAFVPPVSEIEKRGREEAYLARLRALESREPIVRRIALAVPQDGEVILLIPDSGKKQFLRVAWPPEWSAVRERLLVRLKGEPVPPDQTSTVFEAPRFGPDPGGRRREQEWLLLDLNVDYVRDAVLPAMLNRYLGDAGRLDYDAQVVAAGNPSQSIYGSMPGPGHRAATADASVGLLDIRLMPSSRNEPAGRFGGKGPPPRFGEGHGAWLLLVHHHAGSLEALVAQARWRNVALSGTLLLLIFAMIASLIYYSRQAQKIAELQMNFVSGVSHELRTPLTVIRTAAFNLHGKLASRPDQVERYGRLIQDESEKLTALVEQILRYGNAKAGRVTGDREPIAIAGLIEDCLQSSRFALERTGLLVEKQVEPGLPLVLADEVAMKHALQNLLDNAVKYGTEGNAWIGVFAVAVRDAKGAAVEIRIVDRGRGIPQEERERIFDPFFRGRRAIEDQVHGTGLGLNLAKKIIEAHGGTIQVNSELMKGTEFVVRIPAEPTEGQDEFAHSLR